MTNNACKAGGPEPYFAAEGIQLFHGDCFDVLQRLQESYRGRIAAVVTSPPYAEQRKSTYGGIPEADYPAWTCSWMGACRPVLADFSSIAIVIREHRSKPTGMSDYVHRTRMAAREAGWFEVDEMVWLKPNSAPMAPNTLPRRAWERILWFSRVSIPHCHCRDDSSPVARQRDFSSLQAYQGRIGATPTGSGPGYVHKPPRRPNWIIHSIGDKVDEGYHPARYPRGLAEQLVAYFGEFILDPFAGAGTTGVACLNTGRRCVLIEQSEEYCEIASRRLENAMADPRREAA